MLSPNLSPAPPTTRISVEFDNDLAGAAEALLVVLTKPQRYAQTPSPEHRENPDSTEMPTEHPTAT